MVKRFHEKMATTSKLCARDLFGSTLVVTERPVVLINAWIKGNVVFRMIGRGSLVRVEVPMLCALTFVSI